MFVIPLNNEEKNIIMTNNNNPCKNCAFHNPKVKYECLMTEDIPVVCSVKMRKMKQEKIEVKKI